MIARIIPGLFFIFSFLTPISGFAEHPSNHHTQPPADHLHLSPELIQLLRHEMSAIQEGMQTLVPAIASGNWKQVADIGEKIQHSYIMQQELTTAQVEELHHSLPPAFRELDQSFHHSAGMLAHAARNKNAEVVNFYFYKLTDTCVSCHMRFAKRRFPGLVVHGEGGKQQH